MKRLKVLWLILFVLGSGGPAVAQESGAGGRGGLQDWCDRLTQKLVRNSRRDPSTRGEYLAWQNEERGVQACDEAIEQLRRRQNALGPHICPDNPNCREIGELGAQIAALLEKCNRKRNNARELNEPYSFYEQALRENSLPALASQLRTPGRFGFRCERVIESGCGTRGGIVAPEVTDPANRSQQLAHRSIQALNFTMDPYDPPGDGNGGSNGGAPPEDPDPDSYDNHMSDTDREACLFASRVYQRRQATRAAVERVCPSAPVDSRVTVNLNLAVESPDCPGEIFPTNQVRYHVIRSQGDNETIQRTLQVRVGIDASRQNLSPEAERSLNGLVNLANRCVSRLIRPVWARYGVNFDLSFERRVSDRDSSYDQRIIFTNDPSCSRSDAGRFCLGYSCDPGQEECFNQLAQVVDSSSSSGFCHLILHESGHWLGLPDEYAEDGFLDYACRSTRRPLSNPYVRGQTFDPRFLSDLQDFRSPLGFHVTSVMQQSFGIGEFAQMGDSTSGSIFDHDPLNQYEFFENIAQIFEPACDPTEAASPQYRVWGNGAEPRSYRPSDGPPPLSVRDLPRRSEK